MQPASPLPLQGNTKRVSHRFHEPPPQPEQDLRRLVFRSSPGHQQLPPALGGQEIAKTDQSIHPLRAEHSAKAPPEDSPDQQRFAGGCRRARDVLGEPATASASHSSNERTPERVPQDLSELTHPTAPLLRAIGNPRFILPCPSS